MIRSIYIDPSNPGGLSSVDKLYKAVKEKDPTVTRDQIKKFLKGEYVYSLHHPARRSWPRNRIIVSAPHVQAQADLCDMQAFANENNDYRYILTFIDAFSRYALARPLKTKSMDEVASALESIINDYPILKLQTDRGKEFRNHAVMKMLQINGVFLFFSQNTDIKCSIVERFNRSLKARMFKLFTARGTHQWVKHLQDLLSAYNNSRHRSINIEPAKVNETNSDAIFSYLYDGLENEIDLYSEMLRQPVKQAKFKIGEMVKLRHYIPPFDHRYWPNFTDKYFVIAGIVRGFPYIRYKLKLFEDQNRSIEGSFYEEELLPVDHGDYRIEVKGERRARGREEVLVHYLGYPKKYDAWIPKTTTRKL